MAGRMVGGGVAFNCNIMNESTEHLFSEECVLCVQTWSSIGVVLYVLCSATSRIQFRLRCNAARSVKNCEFPGYNPHRPCLLSSTIFVFSVQVHGEIIMTKQVQYDSFSELWAPAIS
jgi:hypothetical protein